MKRREIIASIAGCTTAWPILARGQTYPTRPIRLIVGFAAGGPTDVAARLIGQWLSERLGQQVLIDNKTGAGSNIATEEVVRAAPDGYTLLHVTVSNAVNAALYKALKFNFLRDIAPVASLAYVAGVLEVHPSFPAKSVPEFIAYAKANPGKVNVATAGVGSAPHLYCELFKRMAGVEVVQVHYRGSGLALPDLIAGQVQAMFDPIASSIAHIRAGKLRALAVTSTARSEVLTNIPTIGDFVPGYEASGWQGIGAPRNTPVEIIERLNREINAGLADPAFKARFADLGFMLLRGSPADFAKHIADETEKWGKVIREANITAE